MSKDPSLEKKIGQLFIAAVPYTNNEIELFDHIEAYLKLHIGGFMIGVGGKLPYIETDGKTDLDKLQRFSERLKKMDPNLFLSVDGEGGELFNIFKGIVDLKPPRAYGEPLEKALKIKRIDKREEAVTRSMKEYKQDIIPYIENMVACQFNMNFSPVLDTAIKGYKGYMSQSKRAYSDDDEIVRMLSTLAFKEMQKNGIIAVGKHFPGYGPLEANPHNTLTPQIVDLHTLEGSPFHHAINEGIYAIMTGHAESIMDKGVPGSLSNKVTDHLRQDLNFNGLVIVDEIFMRALADYYPDKDELGEKRVIDAARCNDIILMSYPKQETDGKVNINLTEHTHFPRLYNAVHKAVNEGELSEQRINQSYDKVKKAKQIINPLPLATN